MPCACRLDLASALWDVRYYCLREKTYLKAYLERKRRLGSLPCRRSGMMFRVVQSQSACLGHPMKLHVLHDGRFYCQSCSGLLSALVCRIVRGRSRSMSAACPGRRMIRCTASRACSSTGEKLSGRSAGRSVRVLNATNGLCRVHEQFGVDAKCLSCRMYPFPDHADLSRRGERSAGLRLPDGAAERWRAACRWRPLLRQYTEKVSESRGF